MARFTPEQAASSAGVKQVIYEWGEGLDRNSEPKATLADLLTEDAQYSAGGGIRMESRRQGYGHRRISRCDSGQIFQQG